MKTSRIFALALIFFLSGCKVISFFPLYSSDTMVSFDEVQGVYRTNKKRHYIIHPPQVQEALKRGGLAADSSLTVSEELVLPRPLVQLLSELGMLNTNRVFAELPAEKIGKAYLVITQSRLDEPLPEYFKDELQNRAYLGNILEFDILVFCRLGDKLYADSHPLALMEMGVSGAYRYTPVHTFAQVQLNADTLRLKFMKNDFLEELFEKNRIRIEHVKREDDGTTMLTASTRDLQKFVMKYGEDEKAFTYGSDLIRETPWK